MVLFRSGLFWLLKATKSLENIRPARRPQHQLLRPHESNLKKPKRPRGGGGRAPDKLLFLKVDSSRTVHIVHNKLSFYSLINKMTVLSLKYNYIGNLCRNDVFTS